GSREPETGREGSERSPSKPEAEDRGSEKARRDRLGAPPESGSRRPPGPSDRSASRGRESDRPARRDVRNRPRRRHRERDRQPRRLTRPAQDEGAAGAREPPGRLAPPRPRPQRVAPESEKGEEGRRVPPGHEVRREVDEGSG